MTRSVKEAVKRLKKADISLNKATREYEDAQEAVYTASNRAYRAKTKELKKIHKPTERVIHGHTIKKVPSFYETGRSAGEVKVSVHYRYVTSSGFSTSSIQSMKEYLSSYPVVRCSKCKKLP